MSLKVLSLTCALLVSSLTTPVLAQQGDSLALLDGVWVAVNPPGPQVIFNKLGLGQRAASLPMGQAAIRVSDGRSGSTLRVSGEGFDCFYLVSPISRTEMVWQLKEGNPVCLPSAHYKKDPPL